MKTALICRLLLEHPQLEVLAVEPNQEMNVQLHKNLPQIRALEGSATNIPLESASLDAVFVAQVTGCSPPSLVYLKQTLAVQISEFGCAWT